MDFIINPNCNITEGLKTVPLWKLASDGEFQRLCDEFVSRNVIHCASTLVSELAQQEEYQDELLEVLIKTVDGEEGEEETREALEHWIVSSWLFALLEDKGEMVLEFMGFRIWGRTTSGQAIAMDRVIEEIVCLQWQHEVQPIAERIYQAELAKKEIA